MPEIEEEVIGSHTEDSEAHERDTGDGDIYTLFGIDKQQEREESAEEDAPAIEQKPEPRIEKVKHNKSEVEVDISTQEQLHDHLQRSLALEKERERKAELERNLDRAAKLAGFNNHAEYIANLDKLEMQQQQKVQDEYSQLRADLRAQAEEAGLDPDQVESYLNNHPLMKEAVKVKQEREAENQERMRNQAELERQGKWQALYAKYPDLIESSKAFNEGENPEWFTAEMQSRIARNYDPVDAYELAHKDKLTAQTKRLTEQKIIKQQQLGLRSQVETITTPDNEPQASAAHIAAFEAFGLPASAAKKYANKRG